MSDDMYLVEIQQAAKGCVSGTLDEWPALAAALRARGHTLPLGTGALSLKAICKLEWKCDELKRRLEIAERALEVIHNLTIIGGRNQYFDVYQEAYKALDQIRKGRDDH